MFDRTDYPYSETFVREAIQNSLDARLDPSRPVVVNFTFHTGHVGPTRAFLEQVVAFRKKAGLAIPREWSNGEIRWLVVEDFNSKGLGGSLDRRTSDFWNYWLNFGISNKDGSGRGGRGIGRVTFLIASRIQSVIGYTRRASDGAAAGCGMAVLRAQEDGQEFLSTHAYLAHRERGSIYELHDSQGFHAGLCSAFELTGYSGTSTSGLALAIPYPHSELIPERILAAAVENFAPAIMNGTLVLKVDGTVLDASTIAEVAQDVAKELNDEAIREDVGRYLRLVGNALNEPQATKITLPAARRTDLEALRKTASVELLQKKLSADADVVLEIEFPLTRGGRESTVRLRAVLAPTPPGRKPIDRLFREGMGLPDVRTKNPGELDLIVVVDAGLLATYLNFCEGKAHLDLLESKDIRQKLEEHGFDGLRVRRLVRGLPTDLRILLTPDISAPDAHVFDTFFSKPSDKPGRKNRPVDHPDPVDPPPPPKPPAFRIDTLQDGLRIRANPECAEWPMNLTVTLAYADGSRHPSWSPFDFKLDDLTITKEGCEITLENNKVKALNCGLDCALEITGFDKNRELDTNIRPWRNA
ncbi:hypothetical protein [Mesorhizobium sp.]|uniref:hypothetical protein n=1 Tax=Mesorhizobium sp. TaxID=1871066 RepID=UPI0025D3F646|nr:hypothetical protein [Mesorhizobium sp.]